MNPPREQLARLLAQARWDEWRLTCPWDALTPGERRVLLVQADAAIAWFTDALAEQGAEQVLASLAERPVEETPLSAPSAAPPVADSWHVTMPEDEMRIVDLVCLAGLASSKGAARRLIEQGGVKVNGVRVADPSATLRRSDVGSGALLQVGKRHRRMIVDGRE